MGSTWALSFRRRGEESFGRDNWTRESWKKTRSRKDSTYVTEEVIERSDNTESKFCDTSERKPNRPEVRWMIGHALQEAIKTAMQNHVYTFDDIASQQNEGGAIGNKLTGAMVKVFMSRWTREFRARVATAAKNIQCPVEGYEKTLDKSGKDLRPLQTKRMASGRKKKEETH